jgi:hypothetical protein
MPCVSDELRRPVQVLIPAGMAIDGAVVELGVLPDGAIVADLRIPGPGA